MKDPYIIIKVGFLDSFIASVNKHIQEGYVPIGGIETEIDCDYQTYYLQAMIFRKNQ